MTKIFKASERRFEENPGRIDGFRLMSDAAIIAGMTGRNADGESGCAKNGPTKTLGHGSLNFDVRRLDGGEISSLYHFHRHAEEMFLIMEGTATLRTPDGLHILGKGDIAFFGTGSDGAHQLYNHSAEQCIYLDIRTFLGADMAEYPDSGRMLLVPSMERFGRSMTAGYFDGEPDAAEARKKFVQK